MPAIVRRWEKRQIAGMARSYKTRVVFQHCSQGKP